MSEPGERAYDAPREQGGNVRPADDRWLSHDEPQADEPAPKRARKTTEAK